MKRNRLMCGTDGYCRPVLVDWNGSPIKRTPTNCPYAFDEHFVWKSEDFDPTTSRAEYSDRLRQFDVVKYKSATEAVWPDMPGRDFFHDVKPEEVNRFLNLYFGREVKLTGILKGCNHSNGFPYWVFAYKE